MKTKLSVIEQETVELFIHYASIFNLPKSVGAIYGLLFCSEQPLALDDIVEKLSLSKGSASQGLRFLRDLNAVTSTYVTGNRRDHYLAEVRLRNLVLGLLRERILPQLEQGRDRLDKLQKLAERDKINGEIKTRIQRLQSWNTKVDQFLPLISKLIGPKWE